MADYTSDEIKKMQQDAVKRVQDMRRKADIKHNFQNGFRQNESIPFAQQAKPPQPQKKAEGNSGILSGLLSSGPAKILDKLDIKSLLHDSDTVMTLAILLLVSAKDNDPMLTLALIYIML